MEPPPSALSVKRDSALAAVVARERARLAGFIRRRGADPGDAEDILQDVFVAFVEAYRLPESIEHIGACLFEVARHRIVDRFRKKREVPLKAADADSDDDDSRLDLSLPSPDAGPEAAYARSVLLAEMQQAIDALPAAQREVFVAHELEGTSFTDLAATSGVPLNTLLARKRYAVLRLRSHLRSIWDDFDT